jgi:hypothetical protein
LSKDIAMTLYTEADVREALSAVTVGDHVEPYDVLMTLGAGVALTVVVSVAKQAIVSEHDEGVDVARQARVAHFKIKKG